MHEVARFSAAIVAMPPMPGEDPATATPGGTVSGLFGKKVREGGVDGITRFEAQSKAIGHAIHRCRQGQITPEEAWEEVRSFNAGRIEPPWPEERLRTDFERIWQRDIENNGDMPPEGHLAPVPFSHDDLANTFAARHGPEWRYIAAWDQWYRWTGKAWSFDDTRRVEDEARKICRAAAKRADEEMSRSLASAATVSAAIRLARTDRRHAATTDQWDSDPWLLNTPNGVLDLRTGKTGPHDPLLHMTKMAGASAGSDCPLWIAFLNTVTGGDPEYQAYLQRMAGYCLSGSTREHALFFLYGTGSNGKSVFTNVLGAVLGDYATVAPMDMFMATHGDRHPTDLAGLRGARLVTAAETEAGARWAESKLKAMTGGDKITARFMRQDNFEYVPQFKLLISGNHKPSTRNVDEAMRRRLHLVPFTVTIPPAERDKRLFERLMEEKDGILAWMVEGCLEWQRIGLHPPKAVLDATEDYFEAEDAIGRWIAEQCDLGPDHTATSASLFADWKIWAEANREYPGSPKRLSEALLQRGLDRHNTRSARGFRGIRLRPPNLT